MKSRAAVAFAPGRPLEIVEIDVASPRKGEVLTQISQYLATGPADSGALYSVWAGGNDLFTQLAMLQAGAPLPPAEPWASMPNTGSW